MEKQIKKRMCISNIFLYIVILTFGCVLSSIPDGDLMYRISQTQLNELAPIMYENPREYFVHGFMDVCQSDFQTIVTSPNLVEPKKDISVVLLDRTSVKVTITYRTDLIIRALYTVSRRSNTDKFNSSVECQVRNAVFSVVGNVGLYKTLRFRQKTLNGTVTGSESLNKFLNETCVRQLLSKVVFELVRHKIDSIFQITYEYPDTQTDFKFLKDIDIHVSLYTIAQQVDIPEFWDIKSFVLWKNNTIPRLPPSIPFPVNLPQVDDAKRFEIWISEKGIQKLWEDIPHSFIKNIGNKLQTYLDKYAEKEKRHNRLMAEDIFFLPQIAKMVPNSAIDAILTKVNMWTTINITSISIFINLSLDITATFACKDKNTTLNIFSMDLNLQFPVQLGVNNFRINGRLLNFGGTVTIRNSTIGMIKNEFLLNMLFLAPIMYGEKWIKKIMDDPNKGGIEIYKVVRDEFEFRNLSLRLVENGRYNINHLYRGGKRQNLYNAQDLVIMYPVCIWLCRIGEADVVPSQSHNETEGNYTWVGYYDKEDWKFLLYETTPKNDTGMPVQHCTPPNIRHSSGGEVGRALSLQWILLGIFIGALVLKQ